MIISVTFKCPDVVDDAIRRAAFREADSEEEGLLSVEDKEIYAETRVLELETFLEKWVQYGELITVEFDTEAKTAFVRPQRL